MIRVKLGEEPTAIVVEIPPHIEALGPAAQIAHVREVTGNPLVLGAQLDDYAKQHPTRAAEEATAFRALRAAEAETRAAAAARQAAAQDDSGKTQAVKDANARARARADLGQAPLPPAIATTDETLDAPLDGPAGAVAGDVVGQEIR